MTRKTLFYFAVLKNVTPSLNEDLQYVNYCILCSVYTHTHMVACTNIEYGPQRANIGQRTIFLHDIYVNCLNVKEREEERERKRQYDGQINRRNKKKRRERGKQTTGIDSERGEGGERERRNTVAMTKQINYFP